MDLELATAEAELEAQGPARADTYPDTQHRIARHKQKKLQRTRARLGEQLFELADEHIDAIRHATSQMVAGQPVSTSGSTTASTRGLRSNVTFGVDTVRALLDLTEGLDLNRETRHGQSVLEEAIMAKNRLGQSISGSRR